MDEIFDDSSNLVAKYIKQDFIEWIVLVVLSCSLVGIPIMLVWVLISSISLGITVSALIHTGGIGYGMSFSILVFMLPVILKILILLLLLCSSLKFIENILRYKKEVRYEIVRHAFVLSITILLICVLAFYRAFSLNLVNNILII